MNYGGIKMNNHGRASCCLVSIIGFIVVIALIAAAAFVLIFATGNKMPEIDEFSQRSSQKGQYAGGSGTISDNIKVELESGGVSTVTVTLNNADLSALATEAVESEQESPIRDIMMICNADATIDMTATVKDLSIYLEESDTHPLVGSLLGSAEGKQLYATISIHYIGSGDFDVSITGVRIGKMNVPFAQQIFASLSKDLESGIEERLSVFSGFSLNDFQVEEDRIVLSYGVSK